MANKFAFNRCVRVGLIEKSGLFVFSLLNPALANQHSKIRSAVAANCPLLKKTVE